MFVRRRRRGRRRRGRHTAASTETLAEPRFVFRGVLRVALLAGPTALIFCCAILRLLGVAALQIVMIRVPSIHHLNFHLNS